MRRLILTSILIFALISLGTAIAILYAKGYRFVPGPGKPRIEGTGLLVLTSKPDGARVYINNHLTTATDNTINLPPGEYAVRIEKDGYFPWNKKIEIKREIVREADALLFPIAPKLEAATITGASNPVIDNSGTFIAYTTASSSATKNGIYVLDMNSRPILTIGGLTTQIAADNPSFGQFSQASLTFSPDNTQILATVPGITSPTYWLLSSRGFNQSPQDVTATIFQLQYDWSLLTESKDKKILDFLPKKVRSFTRTYFKDFSVSPDDDRIMYTASISATLPFAKDPRWMSLNSTPEDRSLKNGNVYVYDVKDDRNYLVFKKDKDEHARIAYFKWHPDSKHIIYIKEKNINTIEYDGKNSTTIYAGPFVNNIVYPWPDGSSVLILTNLNIPDAPYNLYRISLR